jgi:hypothetical protein
MYVSAESGDRSGTEPPTLLLKRFLKESERRESRGRTRSRGQSGSKYWQEWSLSVHSFAMTYQMRRREKW